MNVSDCKASSQRALWGPGGVLGACDGFCFALFHSPPAEEVELGHGVLEDRNVPDEIDADAHLMQQAAEEGSRGRKGKGKEGGGRRERGRRGREGARIGEGWRVSKTLALERMHAVGSYAVLGDGAHQGYQIAQDLQIEEEEGIADVEGHVLTAPDEESDRGQRANEVQTASAARRAIL